MTSTQIDQAKQVVAVSHADYRGVRIIETAQGCSFFLANKEYDFVSLDEATACIDAIYARVLVGAPAK